MPSVNRYRPFEEIYKNMQTVPFQSWGWILMTPVADADRSGLRGAGPELPGRPSPEPSWGLCWAVFGSAPGREFST